MSQPRLPGVSQLIATLTATMPGLLCGWREIAKFCRKSPRQCRAYVRFGLPVYRWGKNIYSHPGPILRWLAERERARRVRKGL